jgi:hypothetical protein
MNDRKLFLWLLILVAMPVGLAAFGGDRFRYPCQDPKNWEKDFCKMPLCDVTRTCPEHIFKGQRDPRLGPDNASTQNISTSRPAPAVCSPAPQGANCAK